MARPIKDTPILTGEDAKRFLAEKKTGKERRYPNQEKNKGKF